jgi:flagellar biosynthetic protein FliR
VLIFASMPFMVEAFSRVIDMGCRNIETLYLRIGVPLGGVQ